MSVEPVLSVRGLVTGYRSVPVVNGLDLTANAGEIVTVLGPNGSGKTTLLKAVCGGLSAWGGEVQIQGRPVNTLSAKQRAALVAYVPQGEPLEFGYSVRELVLMGRTVRSNGLFETPEDLAVADAAMEATDCLTFADRPVVELSGGEAQRAYIARALAQDTPMLLCDEPTTHLDPRHQLECMRLLQSIAKEGRTVLVTAHDVNWASACSVRSVLLSGGVVTYDGDLSSPSALPALHDAYGVPFGPAPVDAKFPY